MASYSSFGTRRALGKRYSVDPALQLEAERLQQEYNLMPGREARALSAEQFAQNMEYQKNRDEQSGKSSMVGTAGNALMTGLTLYKLGGGELGSIYPAIKSGVGKAYSGITGMSGSTAAPSTGTVAPAGMTAAKTVTPATTDTATAAGVGAGVGSAAGSSFNAAQIEAINAGASYETIGALGESGVGAGGAATGTGFTAGSAAGMGTIAAGVIGGLITKEGERKRAIGGSEEAGGARGYFATASQHPVTSVLEPTSILTDTGIVGKDTLLGKVSGAAQDIEESLVNPVMSVLGLGGEGKKICLIVTVCTDRFSPEVNLARKYRDRFLDADQLRGYYALAEQIVPVLERDERCRKAVKKWLVDRLVDYGAYRLGTNMARPRWSSVIVSKVFLATIKTIGMILPVYVRQNGEVF